SPSSRKRRTFAATAGLSIMDSWAEGARRIGMPEPSAFVAYVVTVVSSIPCAILPIVFAVQGAIKRRSAFASRPHISRYSMEPVMAVTTACAVAYFGAFRWTISGEGRVGVRGAAAAGLMTVMCGFAL